MILDPKNKNEAKQFFERIINIGLDFKFQAKVNQKHMSAEMGQKLITEFPKKGKSLDSVLSEFEKNISPYCTNFSSSNFMGFPDAGNSVAAIGASILYNFYQQNLINQSFCGPSATFVEISVLQWLRDTVGYKNKKIKNIWDVGGLITGGGTTSNTIGILLARENRFPRTMEKGARNLKNSYIVIPKGIGHYSVKSGQMWLGCGNRLIEVDTDGYKYDLKALEKTLRKNKGKIMCLVAYAGDSRTMTVDQFDKIADMVKKIDPSIWLHADACHGFSLGFSDKLKYKIKGIQRFDSVTLDPHKVMMTPYAISAILVKDPDKLKSITSLSDLIMKEKFAFGQITPFLGSRPWTSLKLWFVMKNLGKDGLGKIIEQRHTLAQYLADKLIKDDDFVVLHEVGINSVMFVFTKKISSNNIRLLNKVNKAIHKRMIEEGVYHLHQFSIVDDGKIKKGETIYPLRFMCGNPNTTKEDVDQIVEYVRELGEKCLKISK